MHKVYYTFNANGLRKTTVVIDYDRPTYIHDFEISRSCTVFFIVLNTISLSMVNLCEIFPSLINAKIGNINYL